MSAVAVKTVLFVCGSFNPPTNMHLRMFELARDHLYKLGHTVCGGIMSPVHDKYGKQDLVSSKHRCEMVKLALENSTWIRLSEWESNQAEWTRTRVSLDHSEDELNDQLSSSNCNKINIKRARHDSDQKIKVMLLCGADVLESMGVPGLWSPDDISHIAGYHGIVVITRGSSNPARFIYENDILSKYMDKIIIVNEWVTNEISSTRIRRALRRGDSVKYLINDKVERYIYEHGLYSVLESPHNETSSLFDIVSNFNNNNFLTSPNNITTTSTSTSGNLKKSSRKNRPTKRKYRNKVSLESRNSN